MHTHIGQNTLPHRGPSLDIRRGILDRIKRDKSIQVWTPNNLLDLGARSAIDKALQRLVLAGDVQRIDRGLYDVPRTNSLTGKPSSPDYTAIIDAVARREKARFLPDGITAANQLGLTNAVPAKVTVHTDARLRPIHLDSLVINFKRRSEPAVLGGPAGDEDRSDASLATRYASSRPRFNPQADQENSGPPKNKERRFATIFGAVSMHYQDGCATW
jgi:hypothetical protein